MKSLYFTVQGCSWFNYALHCRLAGRDDDVPVRRYDSLGFRIFHRYE
jgi:formylglycine-generating enzyme required for sulfatase activity